LANEQAREAQERTREVAEGKAREHEPGQARIAGDLITRTKRSSETIEGAAAPPDSKLRDYNLPPSAYFPEGLPLAEATLAG
jgi:hypothetical protein